MPKAIYKIAFVERGKEGMWRKFWNTPGALSTNAQAGNRDGSLGRSDIVEAKNLEEAMAIVQGRHANCTVMAEGSARIEA